MWSGSLAYRIEEALSDFLVRRVALSSADRIRSHFGAFRVKGVTVEVMGDIEKQTAGGTWEPPVDIGEHIVWVSAFERRIPVVSLEYERYAYALLCRAKRAAQIGQYLAEHQPGNPKAAEE